MRLALKSAWLISRRARRSRAIIVMDGAVCLHKRHGASAERKRLMDAVTFFGDKHGRKIHQEQHDLRTVFILSTQMTVRKSVQLFEANFVARRNSFLGYFPDR